MKLVIKYLCLSIGLLFIQNRELKAQHLLNGSFEDNTFAFTFAGGLEPFLTQYSHNVKYFIEDTPAPQYGDGAIIKELDTLRNFLWYTLFKDVNFKSPLFGKTYIAITNGDSVKRNLLKLTLSDSLVVGKLYTIRFFAGKFNLTNNPPFSQGIAVGVGQDSSKPQLVLDTFMVKDLDSGGRFYASSFIALQTYKYVYLYSAYIDRNHHARVAIDNIILDTCISPLPKREINCVIFPYTLTAATTGKLFLWNTGDTTQSITVNKIGVYRVHIYDSLGCVSIDSIVLTTKNIPGPITDTFLCSSQPITLTAQNAIQYVWSTGAITPSITVNKVGKYWVNRTNNTTCTQTDSFRVTEKPLPIITSLKDTTVCFDQVAQILLDAGQFKSYLWKPTGETTQTIYSTAAQVYLLSVTDSNNCSTSKQVAVMETCPEFVFVPNAFTPNGDGLNDVFLPQTRNLVSYEMSIVNRWGEIVFKTKNTQQGWDGKDAQADVYVVLINYKVDGKDLQSLKQNVSLLR